MILPLIIMTTGIYLIWALLYHRKDKSLTFSLYLEYLLTAALVIIIILGLSL